MQRIFNPKGGILDIINKKQKILDSRIINFYTNEAAKCMQARASFASCVMLVSLLEYVLRMAYDVLLVSSSKHKASKDLDLFSLINIVQEEGWIGKNELNKYIDTLHLARDLSHVDKVIEYFDNNKEPPKFDIEASQALAPSIV